MSLQRSPWRWLPFYGKKHVPSVGRTLTVTIPQILLSNALWNEDIAHDNEYPVTVECSDGKKRTYWIDIFIQPPPYDPPDLCVEVKGASHVGRRLDYDFRRELDLKNAGLEVISFSNYEVYKKRGEVVAAIKEALYS